MYLLQFGRHLLEYEVGRKTVSEGVPTSSGTDITTDYMLCNLGLVQSRFLYKGYFALLYGPPPRPPVTDLSHGSERSISRNRRGPDLCYKHSLLLLQSQQ